MSVNVLCCLLPVTAFIALSDLNPFSLKELLYNNISVSFTVVVHTVFFDLVVFEFEFFLEDV